MPELFKETRFPSWLNVWSKMGWLGFYEGMVAKSFDERHYIDYDKISEKYKPVMPHIKKMESDPSLLRFISMAKIHLTQKHSTYHICKDFFEVLFDLRDRGITSGYLPDEFVGYFSLPPDGIKDSVGDYVDGLYVVVRRFNKGGLRSIFSGSQPEHFVSISYICEPRKTQNISVGWISVQLKDKELIGEAIDKALGEIPDREFQSKLVQLAINLTLYIHSSDPELLKLTPTHDATVAVKKKYEVGGMSNGCTIPVIAINWGYKLKDIIGEEVTTHVRGHFGWRLCGVGRSQVKLSWIREHERVYTKILPSSIGTAVVNESSALSTLPSADER